MYSKRVKIFIVICICFLLLCIVRLAQMQLFSRSYYRRNIAGLQKDSATPLKTVRGKILDRNSKVIAADQPRFHLYIDYSLTRLLDERFDHPNKTPDYTDQLDTVRGIIDKCVQLGAADHSQILAKIQAINDLIWNRRAFQAWRTNFPDSAVLTKYDNVLSIPLSEAISDFEKQRPNSNERLKLIEKIDIAEMHEIRPLLELKSDEDLLAAQLEFMNTPGIEIRTKAARVYEYNSVAAQTIGWVGPATEPYKLPASEKLFEYLPTDLCGRTGVEYVREAALRGKRGEILYNFDRQFIGRTERQFGTDVTLTLDIELQQRIERYLTDCQSNDKNCKAPSAAIVIDVATGDILALASVPVFDLNRVRYDYETLAADPNKPLINRAIYEIYPPGSVAKPIILIAGLEAGLITPDEVISCPAERPPKGWPRCWIQKKFSWKGHDDNWDNMARNAIKGSCNIYFSQLADRLTATALQQWFSKFGYGRKIIPPVSAEQTRRIRQSAGSISSTAPTDLGQLPPIETRYKRLFGIGQANFRVTPLQVANAMTVIARSGIYKHPKLFIDQPNESIDLNISPQTMRIIRDGMYAVVNEQDGTANSEFAYAGFSSQDVTVYGKTGSTEAPEHAWFAGFAEDSQGRTISIAVIVEGGQHGSSDAAPLARDIIQFCIEAQYLGENQQDF